MKFKLFLLGFVTLMFYIVVDTNAGIDALHIIRSQEDLNYALQKKNEEIVRASCDALSDCLETVENTAGSRGKWLGASKLQPAYIYVRIRQNPQDAFNDVERSFERIITVMLATQNEHDLRNLPVPERYTKIDQFDLAYREQAKRLVSEGLRPFKHAIEEITSLQTREEVVAYKAPKISRDQWSKTMDDEDFASND